MAGNLFSDAGLVARGFNDAGQDNARLAEMQRANQFNTQADPLRLEASRLGLEESRMNAEELRRKMAEQAAVRAAVSGAGPDAGRLGATTAAADAARAAGNLSAYEALSKQIPVLQKEGWGDLVRAAYMGLPPEQAVANFNRSGVGRISAAEWGKDPKTGEILMNLTDAQTGQKQVMNATKLYEMLNPQKSDVHSLGQFGTVVTTPGKPAQTIQPLAAPQRFAPNTGIEKVTYKDADGNERQYLWNITDKKWENGDAPPAGAQQVSSIRRDLPLLQEAEKTLAKIPGMATRTNPENPLDTSVNWTPSGLAVLSRTERLMLGNKGLPATAIIEIATQGKPKRADNGDVVVEYQGRYYPLGGQGGTAVPTAPAPAPRPAAAPRPAVPAPAPSPAPAAPQPAAQSGREYNMALEASDPELRRLGNLSRMKARDPNLDTQTWISYANRLRDLMRGATRTQANGL